MAGKRRRRGTLIATALSGLTVVPFAVSIVAAWPVAFGDAPIDGSIVALALQSGVGSVRTLLAVVTAMQLAVALFVAAITLGLWSRANWARDSATLVFLVFGFALIPLSLGANPDATSALFRATGAAVGVLQITTVGLLWTKKVADDFEDAEWYRTRQKSESEKLVKRWRRKLVGAQPEDFTP